MLPRPAPLRTSRRKGELTRRQWMVLGQTVLEFRRELGNIAKDVSRLDGRVMSERACYMVLRSLLEKGLVGQVKERRDKPVTYRATKAGVEKWERGRMVMMTAREFGWKKLSDLWRVFGERE